MQPNLKRPSALILMLFFSSASITALLVTPALPAMQAFYHVTHRQINAVMTLFMLGYLLGQLCYSPLAMRFGRLVALRCGLVLNLIGLALVLLFGHDRFTVMLIGRFLSALGAASGLVCTFILINEIFEHTEAKRTIGKLIIAFTFGSGIAVSIGGFLTEYLGWMSCFDFLFLYGAVLLILSFRLPETMQAADKQALKIHSILQKYWTGFRCYKLVTFAFIFSASTAFSYAVAAGAPMISHVDLHLSPAQYGIWNLLNPAGMLIGTLVSNYLISRVTHMAILTTACSIALVCSLLLFFGMTHCISFFILTSFIYFATALILPTASVTASNALSCKSTASATTNFINMATPTVVVFLLPEISKQISVSFLIVCVTLFIGALISLALFVVKYHLTISTHT